MRRLIFALSVSGMVSAAFVAPANDSTARSRGATIPLVEYVEVGA
jgi:hypothetical protein